jgi:hypothetical protein
MTKPVNVKQQKPLKAHPKQCPVSQCQVWVQKFLKRFHRQKQESQT